MELYWFVTDKNDKVIPTGNWNKMVVRKTQACFRNYTSNGATKVHLIDLISGKKTYRDIDYATSKTNEALSKEMKKDLQPAKEKKAKKVTKPKSKKKEVVEIPTSVSSVKGFVQSRTKTSPEVTLDFEAGVLKLEGNSVGTTSHNLYKIVLSHLLNTHHPGKINNVEVKLDYFDTASSKYLLDIFKVFESYPDKKNLSIKWFYEEFDEDMMECGEDYQAIMALKIDLVPYTI